MTNPLAVLLLAATIMAAQSTFAVPQDKNNKPLTTQTTGQNKLKNKKNRGDENNKKGTRNGGTSNGSNSKAHARRVPVRRTSR